MGESDVDVVISTSGVRPEEHLLELVVQLRGLGDEVTLRRLSPRSGGPALATDDEAPPPPQELGAPLPRQSRTGMASCPLVLRPMELVKNLCFRERATAQLRPTREDWAIVCDLDLRLLQPIRAAAVATRDEPYAHAYENTFAALDELEQSLGETRYLQGNDGPTVADWWLLAILLRFDAVYYGLYKLNRGRIRDMPNLHGYCRDLFQRPGIAETFDFEAVIRGHHYNRPLHNPKGRVPLGGRPDLFGAHDRDRFGAPTDARDTEENQRRARARGEWVRKRSAHRRFIREGEPGRYHLYVANNCPWCHRVALARGLLGLEAAITMDVLFYRRDPEHGWQFKPDEPGCTPDTVFGHRFIRELYARHGSAESSVPILFDKGKGTIVNNESADIVRMLGLGFQGVATRPLDLYPAKHREEIDALNRWIYTDVNNGAYKAGFASSQRAYEVAYRRFFAALDRLEGLLMHRRFLVGDAPTEADVRLFPTIFRFDHVYYTRFHLNEKMVRELPNLARWRRDFYALPGVKRASNLEHARRGYFGRTGNNIVPLGPDLDPA